MYACYGSDEKIVELLLNSGASITVRNNLGNTAYDIAKINKFTNICEMLKNRETYRKMEEHIDIHVKSDEEIKEAVSKLAKKLRG